MHPSHHAQTTPDKPAFIMARTGEVTTYRQLEDASNQAAQYLRSVDLKRGDAIAIFMENSKQYFEICFAALRSGLYFTCISSRLTAEEIDYIVGDCDAKVFITSSEKSKVAEELLSLMPKVKHKLMIDASVDGYDDYETVVRAMPTQRIADESSGTDMLYSSGTTGRPKGVRRDLPETAFDEPPSLFSLITGIYGLTSDSIYLSPAPLYHAAPLRYNISVMQMGGTSIIMDKFDAEEALKYIEQYKANASQWVPTMFVRMLKLPEDVRLKYDVSSMKTAIHAAAPCPVPIKEQMIDWWGPVIFEYYAGTEGNGFCTCNSEQWLAHKGTVGIALSGIVHICDDSGKELPIGEAGTIYFEGGAEFTYHNDDEKTADSRHPKGWTTLGDVGRLDEDGFLYLTDRKAFMIISGGVNVYPQETENLLITHPRVTDVAVIGVPNEDFGEEVKAVVQPAVWEERGEELGEELIAFCREHLSAIKCPRSVDFMEELPRHATGKLYKRLVRDRYWGNKDSKIV